MKKLLFIIFFIGLLGIGLQTNAYTQDFITVASSTWFIWNYPPYSSSTLEGISTFTEIGFSTSSKISLCGHSGSNGSYPTDFYEFGPLQTSSCATNTTYYLSRCDLNFGGTNCHEYASTNLGYVAFQWTGSIFTTDDFFDCASLTPYGYQWCYQVGGDYCSWDYASSACVSIAEKPCGDNDRCYYCDTQADCETFSTCDWSYEYVDKFKDIWNETSYWEGGRCGMKDEDWVYSTSTQTQGFGYFRRIFNNKLPFSYIYSLYDTFYQLSTPNSTTGLGDDALTLTMPEIWVTSTGTYATTVMVASEYELPLISMSLIYSILNANAWATIKQFMAFALVIALGFAIIKKIKTIIHLTT